MGGTGRPAAVPDRRKVLSRFAALVASLALLAACASSAPTSVDVTQSASAPTQDVTGVREAGGQSQFIDCRGSGSPTVVLISGVWGYSKDWKLLLPSLREGGRVCVYDRPGLGASPPRSGSLSVDSGVEARELRDLLVDAGEQGPYVLVGHSYGGLLARSMVNLFPQSVAGLVLLDAVPPGFHDAYGRYPVEFREGSPESAIDLRKSAEVAGPTESLKTLPVGILVAGDPGTRFEGDGWMLWNKAQVETAAASQDSLVLTAPGAPHGLPEMATQLCLGMIGEVRSAIREGRPIARSSALAAAIPTVVR